MIDSRRGWSGSVPFEGGTAPAATPAADQLTDGIDIGELFAAAVGIVLRLVLSSPWLVGLTTLLVVSAVIRSGRAIVHGRHGRDTQRRFSRAQRTEILERAGQRCESHAWLFGRCRTTRDLQADHVHPHARGGVTTVANGQALCTAHNKRKGARVPWNWELARLAQRRVGYFPPGIDRAVVRHHPRARPDAQQPGAPVMPKKASRGTGAERHRTMGRQRLPTSEERR